MDSLLPVQEGFLITKSPIHHYENPFKILYISWPTFQNNETIKALPKQVLSQASELFQEQPRQTRGRKFPCSQSFVESGFFNYYHSL